MKIRDILAAKGAQVETVYPSQRVAQILRLFDERQISSVVVMDAARHPLGLVTDRSLIHALARHGERGLNLAAVDAMATPLPTCTPDMSVPEAMRRMTEDRVRHLVVMREEAIAGIVSIGDLVKYRLKDAELEASVLRDMALKRLAAE